MDKKQEWRYLFDLIRYSLEGGERPKVEGTPDWPYLYRICKAHKIEAMVYDGLERLPKEEQPQEEIMKKFREKQQAAIARTAVQDFSLEELLERFEQEEVENLPLKGVFLKQFYPRADQRIMADFDILYHPEQEKKMDRILTELGYVCDHKDGHHIVYFRKPFMNVEMHYRLVSKGDPFFSYYENVWEKAVRMEGRNSTFCMRWEDFYLFMLVHMAKHLRNGGTGIRSVVDIRCFLKQMEKQLDWVYINGELKKLQLTDFERKIRRLEKYWFENPDMGSGNEEGYAEQEAFYARFTELVVEGSIYGTMKNYNAQQVAAAAADHTVRYGRFRVKLSLIFPSTEVMSDRYPYLKKFPALLPAAWLSRIVRVFFFRRGRATEVLAGVDMEDSQVEKWQYLLKELGF